MKTSLARRIIRRTALSLIFCWASQSVVSALTADEAYRAIPHRRTVFRPQEAKMPAGESDFLVKLFDVCDLGTVAKVVAGKQGDAASVYEPVWKAGQALIAPTPELKAIEKTIQMALKAERSYLGDWGGHFNSGDPRVQSASANLHQAYNELMRLYPSESPNNKQAFFDYLCALDFM